MRRDLRLFHSHVSCSHYQCVNLSFRDTMLLLLTLAVKNLGMGRASELF